MDEFSNYICVCRLMRSHGIKGFIKAKPLTHNLDRHKLLKEVTFSKEDNTYETLILEDSKQIGNLWLLKFKGYDNPESLKKLVNGFILIPPEERLPPPEGEYYLDDLIHFSITTEHIAIGTVLEVEQFPTVNAFLVEFSKEYQKEYSTQKVYVPWINDCVTKIDRESKSICCDKDYLKALCSNVS